MVRLAWGGWATRMSGSVATWFEVVVVTLMRSRYWEAPAVRTQVVLSRPSAWQCTSTPVHLAPPADDAGSDSRSGTGRVLTLATVAV